VEEGRLWPFRSRPLTQDAANEKGVKEKTKNWEAESGLVQLEIFASRVGATNAAKNNGETTGRGENSIKRGSAFGGSGPPKKKTGRRGPEST